jgi:hypothetical protein
MRLLVAAVAIALLAVPAYSQAMLDQKPAADPAEAERKRADERAREKAYRSASDNIPVKPAADPWASVRGAEKTQNTQTKPRSGSK